MWTSEFPGEYGYYWIRINGEPPTEPDLVRVEADHDGALYVESFGSVPVQPFENFVGVGVEWWPISPPPSGDAER